MQPLPCVAELALRYTVLLCARVERLKCFIFASPSSATDRQKQEPTTDILAMTEINRQLGEWIKKSRPSGSGFTTRLNNWLV